MIAMMCVKKVSEQLSGLMELNQVVEDSKIPEVPTMCAVIFIITQK